MRRKERKEVEVKICDFCGEETDHTDVCVLCGREAGIHGEYPNRCSDKHMVYLIREIARDDGKDKPMARNTIGYICKDCAEKPLLDEDGDPLAYPCMRVKDFLDKIIDADFQKLIKRE